MTWVLWQDIDEGAKLDCFSSYRMCSHRYQLNTDKILKKKKKKLNTDKLKGLISPPQPETSQTKIVE